MPGVCMTRKIDPALIPPSPSLQFEQALWTAGLPAIAGIDEAGRGCLAGPVAAAAVIFPEQMALTRTLQCIKDSKQLTENERGAARTIIEQSCQSWGVGFADNLEIDSLGIIPATRLAIQRALEHLTIVPDHLLVDYLVLPDLPIPQTRLVKGDARSLSIAAASILAKTHRDAMMISLSEKYPNYDLGTNKGYGTVVHREAIQKFGPTPLHRLSFAPLRQD